MFGAEFTACARPTIDSTYLVVLCLRITFVELRWGTLQGKRTGFGQVESCGSPGHCKHVLVPTLFKDLVPSTAKTVQPRQTSIIVQYVVWGVSSHMKAGGNAIHPRKPRFVLHRGRVSRALNVTRRLLGFVFFFKQRFHIGAVYEYVCIC